MWAPSFLVPRSSWLGWWDSLALLALLACTFDASAQPVQGASKATASSMARVVSIANIEVLADPEGKLSLEAVRQREFGPPPSEERLSDSSVYWLRMTLANSGPHAQRAYVQLAGWDRVTLHQELDGEWVSARSGNLLPFAERAAHLTLLFGRIRSWLPVTLPARSEQAVYARVERKFDDRYAPHFSASLRDAAHSEKLSQRHRFFQGAFQGVILVLLLYNLVLLVVIRDHTYFYYVLGVGGFGLIWAGNAQFTLEFLWPNMPILEYYYFPFAAGAAAIGTLQFLRSYLDTRRWLPRFDRALFGLLALTVAFLVVSPALSNQTVVAVMNYLAFPVYLLALGMAIWAVSVRHPLARYFFAAHICASGGNVLWLIQVYFGNELGLPPQTEMAWGFGQIGIALEGVLLSLGLADRIKRLDQEKRVLIEGQRNELETKVTERTAELSAERERSEALLANILPGTIAEELKRDGKAAARRHEEVTILFTDFDGFTQTMSTVPAQRLVHDLDEIFSAFDDIVTRHGLEKIKTIGDAYMAAAGLPEAMPDHAPRAARAALDMQAWIAARNESASIKWHLRAGLHSGPVVAGVVGRRKFAYDVWGDTVNIASRMESSGEVGRVNVSAYTYDLLRNDFQATYRGRQSAKGKGEMDMYFVDRPLVVQQG